MNHRFHRRVLLQAGCALGLAGLLPAARACEYFAPNLRITHPNTRATGPGETSAVVTIKFDEVTRADRLVAVRTPVATGAEIGGTQANPAVDFAIPEGEETWLREDRTFLRLTGLKQPLQVSRSYPLTLVFEHGGEVAATLNIDYARFM
ncbi:copper chaperone PCu(A)C [Aquincola tertiaricarbonis]|uniref:copper chaperone PCu(A)C n=1 Tax=Aquincola tertiaricarbonis TaxID=391953 RepID=UPI0006149C05|nr:copper chaperone PCu(A)C [Aquincola tertiaricarbonis]